jgi:putative FmdB family regulatory protein
LPVYEYRCSKGHSYEKTEGFSAPSTQKCTVCGARARRQISMPAVIFKGSGFYSTDNRGSGARGGRTSSSDGETPAATPAASDNGHGHSHGPGGHTHGAETKTAVE